MENVISAVIAVSSNRSVWPLPRFNISFILLSAWTTELSSTPNIIVFLKYPSPLGNQKVGDALDQISYSEY